MLILSAPPFNIAVSLSLSIVSGLPASTVNSLHFVISKLLCTVSMSFSSCRALSVVGVPPPIYTLSSCKSHSFAIFAVYSISLQSSSRYGSINFCAFSIDCDTNEQYEHLDGQNGIDTYKLNDLGLLNSRIFLS